MEKERQGLILFRQELLLRLLRLMNLMAHTGFLWIIKTGSIERYIMAKLVVFYSRALFKIEQQAPYAVDYDTCIAQAKKDLQENARSCF